MSERPTTEVPLRVSNWQLGRIADAVGGRLAGPSRVRPAGVWTDTRTIEEGELFVALEGPNFDGHDFVGEAGDAGAVGAVVRAEFERSDELPDDFALIRVPDPEGGLGRLGEALWSEARDEGLHTIDVTGSNGKTTTKELLSAVWSTRGEVFSTPGNLNNEIGLPLTLCALPAACDHLVVEMGANAPGEISELVRRAPGEERLITSIGVAHTEGFGSVEGVRRAKSEIFECASADTLAVVPHAERKMLDLEEFPGRVWTFGEEQGADLRLESYRAAPEGPDRFTAALAWRDRRVEADLELPGRHNGLNLACALSTLVARGGEIDVSALQKRLLDLDLPGGRWRRSRFDGLSIIDDAYNANPTSVRASFRAFLEADPEMETDGGRVRRVAVLGDMRELGDDAQRWHREVAAQLASEPALDAFCAVGSFAEALVEGASEEAAAGTEVVRCEEPSDVADWLRDRAPAFVWMKASRASELERVVDWIRQAPSD